MLISLAFSAHSQFITAFHEDFELPSLGDSMISSQLAVPGSNDWGNNSRIHQGVNSLRCDSCQVKTGKTTYLTSQSFSTVGNYFIILTYWQICKVDPLDGGYIDVSADGGLNWTQLTVTQYVNNNTLLSPGVGSFYNNGNRFTNSSYGSIWSPSSPTSLPLNTWYRQETFDISLLIPNCPNAKVRFRLPDGGTPGPGGSPPNVNNNRGWYVDNVLVKMSFSEMTPPQLSLANPIWSGITFNPGPYLVHAKASDLSGISAVKLIYTLDGAATDTLVMSYQAADTSWTASLPHMTNASQLCYWVIAYDAAAAHNMSSTLGPAACVSLQYSDPLHLPFSDNFDGPLNLWEASAASNGSVWEWGSPTYSTTNSAHSPPKCWDVNLNSALTNNAFCTLTSPTFDFSNVVNARLSCWINFNTESATDGFRLQYSTDMGLSWTTLGHGTNPNADLLGDNWYTIGNLNYSGEPAWEGMSSGWTRARYILSVLNMQTNPVRFRFLFLSNYTFPSTGISVDDFSIAVPSAQEARAEALTVATNQCGMGLEPVKMRIKNIGSAPLSGLTAGYRKDANYAAVTEVVSFSPPLAVGDTLSYTFTNPVDLSVNGTDALFNMKAWISVINDPEHGDDSVSQVVYSKYTPQQPIVNSPSITYGTSAQLTANAASPVSWYTSQSGGSLLSSGFTYITNILFSDTAFYAQAMSNSACVSSRAKASVHVAAQLNDDMAVLSVISPVSGISLQLSPPDTVKIILKNYGTATVNNCILKYRISGPTPDQNVSASCSFSIQSLNTATFTFAVPGTFPITGVYILKAWVEYAGDMNHSNDSATVTIENIMPPYCTSGGQETSTPYQMNIGNVTINNLNNGIGLPTLNNPTCIHNYTDFSNLPPIQLSQGHDYNFSFSAIYGTVIHTTVARVFVDWNRDGIFDEATESAFKIALPYAGPYTGQANIHIPMNAQPGTTRFRVILRQGADPNGIHPCGWYNYGETEDYTANISAYHPLDVGISKIVEPQAPCNPLGNPVLKIRIKNFGQYNISNIPVHAPDGWFNIPDTLHSGDSIDVNVGTLATSGAGVYSFKVYTALQADSIKTNDTLSFVVRTPPNPAGSISGPSNICAVTISADYSVPFISEASAYAWTLPPGISGFSNTNHISLTFSPGYSYGSISVKGTNACGEGVSSQMVINRYPLPLVNTGPDQSIDSALVTNITATVSAGTPPYLYHWNSGESTQNISVSPAQNTTYIVTVTDSHNCSATDTVNVNIINPLRLKTIAPHLTICPGNFTVPILVTHFLGVASASLTLNYNDSLLTYQGYQNLDAGLYQGVVLVNGAAGKVQLAWYSLNPISIDSGILVAFKFYGLSGSSALHWDLQVQGACQYTGYDELNIKSIFVDGAVSFGQCGNINGHVSYDNSLSTALSNTYVNASVAGTLLRKDTTDSQGFYQFTGLNNGFYTLNASTPKAWGGVNSIDALTIMKYFTGVVSLSGMKLLAADVNASGYVNTVDAQQIARRFVNIISSFSAGEWLFSHDTTTIANNNHVIHLKGICVGDANGSYVPGAKEGNIPLLYTKGRISLNINNTVDIPIVMENETEISSVSMVMNYDASKIKINQVRMISGKEIVFNSTNNELRISWYSLEPLRIHPGDTLFILHAEMTESGFGLIPEFSFESGTVFSDYDGNIIPDLKLFYPEIHADFELPFLGQNIPNPFSSSTIIPFYLPSEGFVRLEVLDVIGRNINTISEQIFSAGYHEIIFNKNDLKQGIYFYEMEVNIDGNNFKMNRKMILNY